MAIFISKLSPRAWITVDEVRDWLSVKNDKVDVPQAEVKSYLVFQDLLYTSKLAGILGDTITIEYITGGIKGSEVVLVVGNAIQVKIQDNSSTADDIKTAVENSAPASALVVPTISGLATAAQTIQAATNLAGGIDDVPFSDEKIPETRRRYELLINSATARIEALLNTNVIAKEYQENIDGSGSNTIVPSKWPMLSVTELSIDYNRSFTPQSVIDSINYILRGAADVRQDVAGGDLRIVGNDVVLVSSDNDNVLGQIFAGSVLGSIKIKYLAGWGRDADDVPYDLKMAALQLVEFWEHKRSNRDIGIAGKGVRGETYTKIQDGIPDTITEVLDQYINHSFGMFEKVQNNVFGI